MRTAPLFEDDRTAGSRWLIRTASDDVARSIADRHYNRKTIGARTVGPPGRRLVFVTDDDRALWITHYPRPDLTLDGIDALRCSSFRNEGAGLSSDLIRDAMALTERLWPEVRPPGAWLTFVDTAKVASEHPGYCFKAAGWWLDRTYAPGPHARTLIRLRAALG